MAKDSKPVVSVNYAFLDDVVMSCIILRLLNDVYGFDDGVEDGSVTSKHYPLFKIQFAYLTKQIKHFTN